MNTIFGIEILLITISPTFVDQILTKKHHKRIRDHVACKITHFHNRVSK